MHAFSRWAAAAAVAGLGAASASTAGAQGVVAWQAVGDAIVEPLTAQAADAGRGRAIVADRQTGLCLLCHSGPFPEERFQGNLAPTLAGAGARWNPGQLRLRIADPQRLNPSSLMPAYHRTEGLARVGRAWRDKPVLSAQQVEDVVAFLATLKP